MMRKKLMNTNLIILSLTRYGNRIHQPLIISLRIVGSSNGKLLIKISIIILIAHKIEVILIETLRCGLHALRKCHPSSNHKGLPTSTHTRHRS